VFEQGEWRAQPGADWRAGLGTAADLLPVTQVSWNDARQFCRWAADLLTEPGYEIDLPNEAEWEFAGRGGDGRLYPWGNQPADHTRCSFDNQLSAPSPVQRYGGRGSSPYGCLDLAGNVWEWTRSAYQPYPYLPGDGRETVEANKARVIRGGAWDSPAALVRCSARARQVPDYRASNLGFRVVLRKTLSM